MRAELNDLDVESVAPASSDKAPPGAKGVDPASLTALLITLSATDGVFTVLLETARDWLARHASARRVSVTMDGDTLVLEKASPQEQRTLIKAYLCRHGVE